MGINRAYHIDFPTVKQLLYKLSSATIRDHLGHGLEDVKARDDDIYNKNNYLITLRQLLNNARIQVDEELNTITLNKFSDNGRYDQSEMNDFQQREENRQCAQENKTQFSNPTQNRGQRNNYNNSRNQHQKRRPSYEEEGVP